MGKFSFFFLFLLLSIFLFAANNKKNIQNAALFVKLPYAITLLKNPRTPFVKDNYIIFSYKNKTHPAGEVDVVFKNENFSVFHKMQKNQFGVFYLAYKLNHLHSQLQYLFVVDGIKILDPNNMKKKLFGYGFYLSCFTIQNKDFYLQDPIKQGSFYIFDYHGKPGQNVQLVGSFNNFNPFSVSLFPTKNNPSLYSAKIKLPQGTNIYYFLVDGKKVIDPHNYREAFAKNLWDPQTDQRAMISKIKVFP